MLFERSEAWRKYLEKLNKEQRKEFYNKLEKLSEEYNEYQREYSNKCWEQQKEKELIEFMKLYTKATFHIKSSFRKKIILYLVYPKRKIINPNAKIVIFSTVTQNIKFYNIKDVFYNDKHRGRKHERMLRYMRTKYPIEY